MYANQVDIQCTKSAEESANSKELPMGRNVDALLPAPPWVFFQWQHHIVV